MNDALYVEKIEGDIGDIKEIDTVALVGTPDYSVIGRPYVDNAIVVARIEEQTLTRLQWKICYKKGNGNPRRKPHRQKVTRLRIEELRYEPPTPELLRPIPLIFSRGIPYKPKPPLVNKTV